MIVLKNINMTLDPNSIESAIKQVERFEKQLKPAMQCLINYLGEKGVEVARAQLLFVGGYENYDGSWIRENPGYQTGALSNSITFKEGNGETDAAITAGEGLYTEYGSHAMFVEYGTGIMGQGTYPVQTDYKYDVHHHGNSGWFFKGPGNEWYSWTRGMVARPFMYNTLLDLEEEAKSSGPRVIAEYIRGERA